MGLFGNNNNKPAKKNEGGLMDAIRCDEQDYLIWKWRPKGEEANSTKKENAIRFGSTLSVKDGEVAVFLYHQKDGTQIDYIEGPYNDTIKTANFPVLSSIVGVAFGGASPFQAEIYYINMAGLIQSKFGIPYFDMFDPRFMDLGIPTAVRGSFSFGITNAKEFVKLHKLGEFNLQKFEDQIKDSLVKYVKGCIIDLPTQYQIPIARIESKIMQINDIVEGFMKPKLENVFGVTVKTFDISSIEIDKESEGWNKCKNLTTDFTTAQMASQQKMTLSNAEMANKMQMDAMAQTQAMNLEHMKDSLKIQREEGQYAQHLQTGMNIEAQKAQIEAGLYGSKLQAEQQNIGAFGIKNQTTVGVAAAEAMGKMGAAGSINLGSGGAGINPGAMMANMAMGQTVGIGMANMMGNAFGQMNNIGGTSVPPVPGNTLYNVAVNGASTGPYSTQQLAQMASSGQLTSQTMIWANGMAGWTPAGQVPELASLFGGSNVPPLPPVPPPLG